MRFIIVNLEATCWENARSYDRMEIIEIGAVEMIAADAEHTAEFTEFVRPVSEPILSEFCVKLTSIQQAGMDAADPFPVVFYRFLDWIGTEDYVLCSWGGYNQSQLRIDCQRHGIEFPRAFSNHINVKKEFASVFSVKSCGMQRALAIAGIPLDGTHHRGIDDARNIARLARLILPRLSGKRL